jgi:ATP-dependent RNA helicase SrmB
VFEELQLDRRLQLGLDALALPAPTEVQQLAVPAALGGADLRISAETGSGKTLAYLIPIIQRTLGEGIPTDAGTLALVLVPTRELARQVLKQARALLANTPLRAEAITGGADFKYQKALLRRNPEILVATPGRLLEHCEKGSADLAALRTLVLDEADRMLDMGFRDDVLQIAGRCPPGRQVLMLSATLHHRGLREVSRTLLHSPGTIAVGEVRQPHSGITHQVLLADSQAHKNQLLLALLQQGGYRRALVFGNRRATAARLAGMLRKHHLRCDCLHGELTTEERKRVMARFQDGRIDILCASDVAARGLDVKEIDLVVNYDIPRRGDDYLHRTGRTGRAGERGTAISLVAAPEWNLMISIERYLKLNFERRSLPGLKAKYNGPKHRKSSGKAVGSRKKSSDEGSKARSRKAARGKPPRKRPSSPPVASENGFAPLMKKRPVD